MEICIVDFLQLNNEGRIHKGSMIENIQRKNYARKCLLRSRGLTISVKQVSHTFTHTLTHKLTSSIFTRPSKFDACLFYSLVCIHYIFPDDNLSDKTTLNVPCKLLFKSTSKAFKYNKC